MTHHHPSSLLLPSSTACIFAMAQPSRKKGFIRLHAALSTCTSPSSSSLVSSLPPPTGRKVAKAAVRASLHLWLPPAGRHFQHASWPAYPASPPRSAPWLTSKVPPRGHAGSIYLCTCHGNHRHYLLPTCLGVSSKILPDPPRHTRRLTGSWEPYPFFRAMIPVPRTRSPT